MQILFYQVDAFAERPFQGNPAAICPLHEWLPDGVLQSIAVENNLSETAFFVSRGDDFDLRWFTPAHEVDLCGHATLAAGHIVMTELDPERGSVAFHTRSGTLLVGREAGRLVMDLPALEARSVPEPAGLSDALGAGVLEVLQGRDLVAILEDSGVVRGLRPDLQAVEQLDVFAVAVTARGSGRDADVDFVSRFFAPREGIPEDPVTGSLHSMLAPLWGGRLGKDRLRARQVSARGGELDCEVLGDGVRLRGDAVTVIRGAIHLLD